MKRPASPLARTLSIAAVLGLSACSLFQPAKPQPPSASTTVLVATLSGRDEVPPTNSRAAAGMAQFAYDRATHMVTWDVSFSSLTSTGTGAHAHGPADPGGNAGVVLVLTPRNMYPVVGPLHGSATLTDAQAADLLAGKWYVNVHTADHPNGEIRGQLLVK